MPLLHSYECSSGGTSDNQRIWLVKAYRITFIYCYSCYYLPPVLRTVSKLLNLQRDAHQSILIVFAVYIRLIGLMVGEMKKSNLLGILYFL